MGGGGKTQGPHRPQPGDSRSNPGCGNYLEVGFPPEIFEVFCWFRDQLVQVGCQMLRAEMFFPFNTVFVKLEFNSLKLMYNIPIEVIDMDE